MANLITFNLVTLDGFFEGPDHNIDWHNVDDEFNAFALEQLDRLGGLMFGRVTYELMASYWPTASADDPVAERMNALPKFVASRTMRSVDWQNSRLLGSDLTDEIGALKQASDGDIAIFGSGKLIASLMPLGLIDVHGIMVNPVILGRGIPLFEGVHDRNELTLIDARPFASGNVLLRYRSRS
ncbi:MAG: dihydrofolate reductase [Chloroflexi bacterium]|nr:dihydrofolate reductase [Chloroflexota bacterium]